MYCTRDDIENKRLPRAYVLQLTDDENLGEFDDSTGAVPPNGNTPLWSNSASAVNRRVEEAIEDATNEIDSYLSAVYAVPLAGNIPHIINTLAVSIATYYLYLRRGNDLPDSVQNAYTNAVNMLKQFAARKITLPVPAAPDSSNPQPVAVISTKPKIYTDDYGF
jgi:phage gp36-like protein